MELPQFSQNINSDASFNHDKNNIAWARDTSNNDATHLNRTPPCHQHISHCHRVATNAVNIRGIPLNETSATLDQMLQSVPQRYRKNNETLRHMLPCLCMTTLEQQRYRQVTNTNSKLCLTVSQTSIFSARIKPLADCPIREVKKYF